MPFPHVNKDDPFRPSADWHNAVTDAVNSYGKTGVRTPRPQSTADDCRIAVRNAGETTLVRGQAAQVKTDEEAGDAAVPVVAWSADNPDDWGVIADDIPAGGYGQMIVAGTVFVRGNSATRPATAIPTGTGAVFTNGFGAGVSVFASATDIYGGSPNAQYWCLLLGTSLMQETPKGMWDYKVEDGRISVFDSSEPERAGAFYFPGGFSSRTEYMLDVPAGTFDIQNGMKIYAVVEYTSSGFRTRLSLEDESGDRIEAREIFRISIRNSRVSVVRQQEFGRTVDIYYRWNGWA